MKISSRSEHSQFRFGQKQYETQHVAAGGIKPPMAVRNVTQCFTSGETSDEKTVLTIHSGTHRSWVNLHPGEICFPSATETSRIITRVGGIEIRTEPFIRRLIHDACSGELLFKNEALGVSLPYNLDALALDDFENPRFLNHITFLLGKRIEPDTMPRFAAQLIFANLTQTLTQT